LGTIAYSQRDVPSLPPGMSRPPAAHAWAGVNTDAGPIGLNAAATAAPAPTMNRRRLNLLSKAIVVPLSKWLNQIWAGAPW
ncbi:hypothetical protein ABT317_12370, partial [Streptomyces carpinensis]